MKKIDRSKSVTPLCLSSFTHTLHSWDNVTKKNKRKIWVELGKIQDGFCVYCEKNAQKGDGHIEHFFHKGEDDSGQYPFKHLTFDWNNLFGCCNSKEHCGHYKDQKLPGGKHRVYDPLKLIKSDKENPEDYFNFSASGNILVKNMLTSEKRDKAEETIKALNLTAPSLVSSRKEQIDTCGARLSALEAMLTTENQDQYIQEYNLIKDEFSTQKHRTAVKAIYFI
ncbi:TPA: TIGR02646 family protein [Citrobacter freundii]|uniref:retron Ec78 anti-phage system effector HNH endonuclease PtuB n=1 Tax=Citrobacter freundii TaxID=546 RepID=UPI001A1A3A8B|nr:TIGR02646 family protein [Citrobacter freundii]MDE5191307.1 TIGR02646 family protein [Citrobacter freundii]HAT3685850.1 TIGR02646 family protein [Citrobacter freundii]HAT3770375.1 TIGR02646 family protein [Citrobacter freundii]HCC6092572.1 TIGR02646 family protein [Citrobacter freundii]